MNKKYIVRLSDQERGICQDLINKLKGSSQKARQGSRMLKTLEIEQYFEEEVVIPAGAETLALE